MVTESNKVVALKIFGPCFNNFGSLSFFFYSGPPSKMGPDFELTSNGRKRKKKNKIFKYSIIFKFRNTYQKYKCLLKAYFLGLSFLAIGTSLTGETAFLFTGDFRASVDTTVLLVFLGDTGVTTFFICFDFLIAGAKTG